MPKIRTLGYQVIVAFEIPWIDEETDFAAMDEDVKALVLKALSPKVIRPEVTDVQTTSDGAYDPDDPTVYY